MTFGFCFLYLVSRLNAPLYGSDGSISAPATPGHAMPVAGLVAAFAPTETLFEPSTLANA